MARVGLQGHAQLQCAPDCFPRCLHLPLVLAVRGVLDIPHPHPPPEVHASFIHSRSVVFVTVTNEGELLSSVYGCLTYGFLG